MRTCIIILASMVAHLYAAPFMMTAPVVNETPAQQKANLSRNRQQLELLQRVVKECSAMRLVLAESSAARVRRPVEIARLAPCEMEQLKGIICRMKAIKTAPAGDFALGYVMRLVLLGPRGNRLASIDYMDAAPQSLVSPLGYAAGSRYSLSESDSMAWHLLMRADYARNIANNPAPTRMRSKPPKLYKEPPAQEPAETTNGHLYYHEDCDDIHCGHGHSDKDHYCDHPQQ